MKEWLKSIQGVRDLTGKMRQLRAKFTAQLGRLSLTELLDQSSPYHNDFLPIYKVVTGTEAKKP